MCIWDTSLLMQGQALKGLTQASVFSRSKAESSTALALFSLGQVSKPTSVKYTFIRLVNSSVDV